MDQINARWNQLRAVANTAIPTAQHVMVQVTKALGDVPGSVGGQGGGSGGTGTGNPTADAVIAQAKAKLGAPYLLGAEGPNKFDCSGLVDWCFRQANVYDLIGSRRRTAAGYANWFANQGHYTRDLTTRQRGDLITYTHDGKNISHIGIYLGNGQLISALINPWGVKQTNWKRISVTPVGVCKPQYPGVAAAQFLAMTAQGDPNAAEVTVASTDSAAA